jgi:hypothetical protein
VEDRLGLTTVPALLPVGTTRTLGEQRGLYGGNKVNWKFTCFSIWWICSDLASLVLGDLVLGVLLAISALAVRPAGFGNVNL